MWFYPLIFFFIAFAHLSSVKEQYEHLPYPPISPELE
jgi:hypothetical protein